ncbi:uncharacterized protein TRIVIDRAFT_224768 [Trichoderma virens Gv29-8]|uniref:Uncharacterized protein n=1 Tax=Hypocrea virens (strain Gv29-8 / FGSC 10586) TaxID=413071 RepID=G9N1B1_HYPVG|nr:uncharacterized protein TRIVIDRAFT_224768 [Trichoderma virens Gv29-8]EHK19542.1 hypothetical protein TRIVIDRAFT_224768 [Trichoderma virens Gv29-8]UKZ58199.1 hypothetical protein TrVGV298_012066 [Trichoderma virens]
MLSTVVSLLAAAGLAAAIEKSHCRSLKLSSITTIWGSKHTDTGTTAAIATAATTAKASSSTSYFKGLAFDRFVLGSKEGTPKDANSIYSQLHLTAMAHIVPYDEGPTITHKGIANDVPLAT